MKAGTAHPATLALAALTVLAGGCSGGSSGNGPPAVAAAPDNCDATGQKQFVLDVMQDIYFWKSELPVVDIADYASAEDLLAAIVFEPLDRFTFINDAAADDAFFSDSQFIGVGLGLITQNDDTIRVTQAFADGPAAAVGLDRGYSILSINGLSASEVINGDGISAAFGADEVGEQVDLTFTDLAGTVMEATIFKALVTIETVTTTAVFDIGGRRAGYLALRNFVEPTRAALDTAFASFAADGVNDVILDVRYNGGGLVTVAEQLGDLLGGVTTAGNVFSVRTHNADNSFRNVTSIFGDAGNAVDVTRLVIIASGATASASELVGNSLSPFVDVTWVGADTFGKPVGSYGFEFCEKVVHPISFNNVNADGEGDYFDGFKADCPADDDLEHALGDPQETSLAEAINFLGTGTCSTPFASARAGAVQAAKRTVPRSQLSGQRQLIGAW